MAFTNPFANGQPVAEEPKAMVDPMMSQVMSMRPRHEAQLYLNARFGSITQSFRLIQVAGEPGRGMVDCILESFGLDDCPPFAALSYTWNAATRAEEASMTAPTFTNYFSQTVEKDNTTKSMREIRMNGKPFWVGQNLWSALNNILIIREKTMAKRAAQAKADKHSWLKHLNPAERAAKKLAKMGTTAPNTSDYSYFWVDAICIDQENVGERNDQVGKMGEIYSKADLVTIWLGPEHDGADSLFERMDNGSIETNFPNFKTEDDIAALAAICDRLYWGRIWIVQEFLLARELDLLCGASRVSGRAFLYIFESWHSKWESGQLLEMSMVGKEKKGLLHEEISGVFRTRATPLILRKARYRSESKNEQPWWYLMELLQSFTLGGYQATDKRDLIFALRGIASPDKDFKVRFHSKIRYDLGLAGVYHLVLIELGPEAFPTHDLEAARAFFKQLQDKLEISDEDRPAVEQETEMFLNQFPDYWTKQTSKAESEQLAPKRRGSRFGSHFGTVRSPPADKQVQSTIAE